MSKQKYTDEFLISELKRFVKENGRVPVTNDFKNNKKFPDYTTYFNHFGSWEKVLKLTGLYVYTNEFLINELKRFVKEKHKVPTYNDFKNNKDFPSSYTYMKHFRSWNTALELAGFPINRVYKKYTNKELLSELKRFYDENDKIPTTIDFENNSNFPSTTIYYKRFGSWNDALIKAGFVVNKIHKTYTDEFLISELHRFTKENNRTPLVNDFINNNNFPSVSVYTNHFGSWNKALELADLKINKINKRNGTEYCEDCGSVHTIPNWYYKNGKRICNKCYHGNRNYIHGTLDPKSTTGIGVITEHIVYTVLGDCTKCNTKEDFCSEYDLISEKYGNMDVKASILVLNHTNSYYWNYHVNKSSKINYYVCLGFDIKHTQILKVWMIPSNSDVISKVGIKIANSKKGLSRVLQYEVNVKPYNDVYQNLDITTLPEFRNVSNNSLESEVI